MHPTDEALDSANELPETADETVIPVVREQLHLSSREVVTGEVNVTKRVRTERIDVPLRTVYTTYREERVPVGRIIDTLPQPRYEGKNLIIPVVREEEVVVKRLVLVEEIHLIQHTHTDEHHETVELRHEEAAIDRIQHTLTAPPSE